MPTYFDPSDNDALLIHHLLNCKKLNLPYVILQHMICAATKDYRKNIVPYGMVLTKVFRYFGVSLTSETSMIKISKFSTKNLSHMRKTSSTQTPTPSSSFPTSLKRKRSTERRPTTNPVPFSTHSTDPEANTARIPTPEHSSPNPERSPPPPERSPENIQTPSNLFPQTSTLPSSAIPSYSQTFHSPTHDFGNFLSNPPLSTMSPLFVSPQKTSSSIFGISQFLNFPATIGPSNTSIGPLPSVSSSFASFPSISTTPIPSNTVVATTSQPSPHLHSSPPLTEPSNSNIMVSLQIIMARQVQHDQETALLRTWLTDHLAPNMGIPPPPPHPIPPPSQVPHPGKSSSSEGSSPSLAS
uniref:Mucin-2-like n=1 Tax=Cicer arietinum TaxID=3827 RepID=A0A1S3DWE5_CICAR|nr:mucin-2-like [Cicer arietinum]